LLFYGVVVSLGNKTKKGENMRFAKCLLTLAFALCAFTTITNAQTVMLGGGSSALFQELGQAAYNTVNSPAGTGCLWTSASTTTNPPPLGSDYFAATDGRPTIPAGQTDENGKIFFAWNQNGGGSCSTPTINGTFQLYVYMSMDSTLGDRCFFINDNKGSGPGCTFTAVLNGQVDVAAGQITTQPDVPAGIQLPAAITTLLAGAPYNGRFFVAGTDIRPEDALFATQRALGACNALLARQFFNDVTYDLFGGGYGTTTANIGVAIAGDPSFGGGAFHVYGFNITGSDPITGAPVPTAYTVNTVGAQPIIVAVAPTTDGAVASMRDVTAYTLSQYYAGNLGRTTDLNGVTVGEPMNFLVRESLSGTYNTFEYGIPQSTQFHTGQETGNCNGTGTVLQNPMHLATAPGVFGGAVNRIRAIGTGNVVKFLNLAPNGTPTMGYFFWSAGNAKGLTVTKYLTVNGIDPLESQFTTPPAGCPTAYTGIIPGSGATGDPGLSCVTFDSLNAGDYPIWSALRLVNDSRGAAAVSNLLAALDNLTVLQQDYIKRNNMKIWHSHFQIVGQPANAANGPSVGTTTLCAGGVAEGGGDVGGSTMLIVNNANFCHDFSNTTGKLNLTF
jgi:hypothetical protein